MKTLSWPWAIPDVGSPTYPGVLYIDTTSRKIHEHMLSMFYIFYLEIRHRFDMPSRLDPLRSLNHIVIFLLSGSVLMMHEATQSAIDAAYGPTASALYRHLELPPRAE